MRAIWKYPLDVTDQQTVGMPAAAQVLSVADQAGALTVWALVDTEAAIEPRRFWIVGTGRPMPVSGATFLGSVQQGPFVWHVFVEPTLMESLSGFLGSAR